jgi:hypothetical protein
MSSAIIVVSGLPRSGTSLMMQMLDQGGVEIVTDHIRTADIDNPRGYYEFEAVKRVKQDASWLPDTRGKAFKAVSQLLYDFPSTERYLILFMEREFDEMLQSQEKMLVRSGREPAPAAAMKEAYRSHLDRLHVWLGQQSYMSVMPVRYNELVREPASHAQRVAEFLEGAAEWEKMAAAVDPSLYRNRAEPQSATGGTSGSGGVKHAT